ncbi:MAG: hypothetical protein ACPGSD_17175 [Flavobacteriales bacterium]
MHEKKAKEIIKKYVLENFDDRWYPGPTYLEEYPDFFQFYINSRKIMETGDWHHGFVGLGSGYISKKYEEIVQYGSAPGSNNTRENFLKTEYKLSVVRTKYAIQRGNYCYNIVLENITDKEKAFKYMETLDVDPEYSLLNDMKKHKVFEIHSIMAFRLLNLLYFNIIDPFCKITYDKIIIKDKTIEQSDYAPFRPYSYLYDLYKEDIIFQEHMLDKIKKRYLTFKIDECYTSKITNIHDIDRLHQYLPIAGFRYYGEDDQTGFIGYVLGYSDDEIQQMILNNNIAFEFVKGEDILFFLFMNSITLFCEIELNVLNKKNVQ